MIAFYQRLYKSESTRGCNPETWSFLRLTHVDRRWMNRLVTSMEIKAVLFLMDRQKTNEKKNGIKKDLLLFVPTNRIVDW